MIYRVTLHTDRERTLADFGTFADLDEANRTAASEANARHLSPLDVSKGMGAVYSNLTVTTILGVYAQEA